MMDSFDVLLVDLQDVGCRIYTFVTTLRYVLEAAAKHGKSVWVLDRPNPVGPAGRRTAAARRLGKLRRRGPDADASRAHAGRAGALVRAHARLDVECRVVTMEGWQPASAPGYGWPLGERSWVNPSPNAPNLSMARCYAGTVMLEGTTLSEGRGTTRPLELFGAPDLEPRALLAEMAVARAALAARLPPARRAGSSPRFTSTSGKLCAGVQIHVDDRATITTPSARGACMALAFKALAPLAARLRSVARFPVRIRARPARHRLDQRQPAAARMGRRSGGTPADLDGAGDAG